MHYNNFYNELCEDGIKSLKGLEAKQFLATENISVTNFRGYFMAGGQKFANSKNTLFPKRAILRIGMLLRDSEIAKEIRTRLLNIVQDTEKVNPEIIHNVVNEISEEKQLMLDRVEAEMNGDYNKVSIVNAKLFALKNKRIKELEDINKNITTHSLTIIESRAVINRIVRNIAMKEYKGMFGQTWGELYSKMNYILHINIKGRNKKKNESYLDTLNDKETFEVEKIVRNWAVEIDSIQKVWQRNNDEIVSDGAKEFKKAEILSNVLNGQKVQLTNYQGKSIVNINNRDIILPNRGMKLFPKRAILRIGMLLRDSEIAKEIRTRLLDIVQDTEKVNPEIIHNVVSEISEEKQLMLDRVEAEMNGDYNKVSIVNAKLFALKNKRIKELEDINKNITTHSLTIIESRAVINRIVRNIAMKEYKSMFGQAWGELYSKMNYILHINIKGRTKKKGKSYLDTLTDKETFEVEKIVRNWAVEIGLNLDELLKIA
jgi:hypothetical protein